MTWIDSERATFLSPPLPLRSLSANRKQKLGFHDQAKCSKSANLCAKEIARATAELARLVGGTSFGGRAGG
jgi:hypothetical protein